jgi:hypothetical protein
MGGTTAKLVDAPTFDGRGIAATLPRSEVEEAIAGKGDVSLKLEVKARPDGAADFEAHTLEIDWDRADLERMLEQASGDQVTLTFDAGELADVIDPDVEGQALRERVAVLTVAIAAATAGTASYVATTTAHHDTATPSYAYVHSTAPIEQVSDAATGGGYQAADTSDVVSRQLENQGVELASDAATGGYTQATVQGAEQYAGYQHASAPTPEIASDAGTGGYTQETVQGAEQYAGYQHAVAPTPDQVSDAASGGGYAQETVQGAAAYAGYQHAAAPAPEQVSDAATGGYSQDTGDLVSRQMANQSPAEQVSDAATGGYTQETVQGAEQYAGYQHAAAPVQHAGDAASTARVHEAQLQSTTGSGPELTSDAATGGYAQETVQGAEQYAGYQHSAAPSVAAGAEMADVHNVVSDAGTAGGTGATELRSDASTGGYTAPAATPSVADSGSSFDAPGTPGLIAGGIALLITGAALVTGKTRRKDPKPA